MRNSFSGFELFELFVVGNVILRENLGRKDEISFHKKRHGFFGFEILND